MIEKWKIKDLRFFLKNPKKLELCTVEPRNSGKFGHTDIFRYLAGYLPHPKKSYYENILSIYQVMYIFH